MRGSRRVLLLLLLLVVVLLLLVVVLVSLGGGGRALLGKRRRGESSSSSSGRRSSGGAAAVVAAVAAAAAAPAPSSAAGAVPPRRTAAQQDQVSRESVPVSDSDDVADADVAPGRGRERGAAENVDGAGVHLLGLSFLNLFFLFWGKGREILSGGDAEGAKGKKMRFISLSPAIVAPKNKIKETRSLSLARESGAEEEKETISLSSLSRERRRLFPRSIPIFITFRSFFALLASSNASLASDAAITSTSGTMFVTGETGETGVRLRAAMRRK